MTKLTRRRNSISESKTLIEELEEDPRTASELAAAQISGRVHQLLRKAFESSPLSQKELATILGVGESRVSQVLNGDGNIRVTALARYLRAMGYSPEISAVPATSDVQPIAVQKRNRKKADHEAHVYMDLLEDTQGTDRYIRLVIQDQKPRNIDARIVESTKIGHIPDVRVVAI